MAARRVRPSFIALKPRIYTRYPLPAAAERAPAEEEEEEEEEKKVARFENSVTRVSLSQKLRVQRFVSTSVIYIYIERERERECCIGVNIVRGTVSRETSESWCRKKCRLRHLIYQVAGMIG